MSDLSFVEKEFLAMRLELKEKSAQLFTALSAIDEALALHNVCSCMGQSDHCSICETLTWPCPTVAALLKAKGE